MRDPAVDAFAKGILSVNGKNYLYPAEPGESLRQFVGITYLAKAFGVSRQALHMRCKNGKMFPKPVGVVESGSRIWLRAEVEEAAKIFPPGNEP